MNYVNKLLLIVLSALVFNAAQAQRKWTFDVDYFRHSGLGMSSDHALFSFDKKINKMTGNALHLSVKYAVAPRWRVGLGVGADRYLDPEFQTFPIFGSVEFSPLQQLPNAFAFANLGGSFATEISYSGFMGDIGVGYLWRLGKTFGIKAHLGYQLRTLTLPEDEAKTLVFSPNASGTVDVSWIEAGRSVNFVRHSILLGVGLVF